MGYPKWKIDLGEIQIYGKFLSRERFCFHRKTSFHVCEIPTDYVWDEFSACKLIFILFHLDETKTLYFDSCYSSSNTKQICTNKLTPIPLNPSKNLWFSDNLWGNRI